MSRIPIDHDRHRTNARLSVYTRLDRILAGEAGHPIVKTLARRSERDVKQSARVLQYLRIERGRRA